MMQIGRIRLGFGIPLCLCLCLFSGRVERVAAQAEAQAADASTNPFAGDADAIAEGEMLFEAVCAGYCHVKAGNQRDGKCPNLFDCEWKHGKSDEEMFRVVANGVSQTEMQGFQGQLPDDMLWQVIAYVRSASECKAEKPTAATPAH